MKNKKLWIPLKWGLLLGACLAVVQFIKTFTDDFDFYSFGPIIDLLMVLLFIGGLYLGIKEYRDAVLNGQIKFGKAFGIGIIITFIGFLVMFFYLVINYQYINTDSLSKLNQKNEIRFIEKVKKDTLTTADLTNFIQKTETYLRYTDTTSNYSECQSTVQNTLDTISYFYALRLNHRESGDTLHYNFRNFDKYAQKELLTIHETINREIDFEPECEEVLTNVIKNTVEKMRTQPLLDEKIASTQGQVAKYDNVFATALYFSLSILLYGLFFDLFIAMYLYRSKKEESENEEDNNPNEEEINNENN